MIHVKSYLSLIVLLSGCINSLNGYDVKNLQPFGKTAIEIIKNIKKLAEQKITIIDSINLHFAKQENEIIDQIKTKYHISDAEWQTVQNYYENLIAQDPLFKPFNQKITHQPYEHTIIKKAREMIAAYGMNPNAVTILDSGAFGTAGVISSVNNNVPTHALHLHIPELQLLTDQEVTGIVRHELTHLWYSDSLKLTVCWNLFSSKFNPLSEPLISDYRKNFEMRADAIGTIKNNNFIQGLSTWFQKYTHLDQYAGDGHPTFTDRINALKMLTWYVNEAKKPATAA